MIKQEHVGYAEQEEMLCKLNLHPNVRDGKNNIWQVKSRKSKQTNQPRKIMQRKTEYEECSSHKTWMSSFGKTRSRGTAGVHKDWCTAKGRADLKMKVAAEENPVNCLHMCSR